MEIGLIDQLGGVQEAIEWVANKADITNYGVPIYPRVENNWFEYLTNLQSMEADAFFKNFWGDELSIETLNLIKTVLKRNHIQARMPEFTIGFKPYNSF